MIICEWIVAKPEITECNIYKPLTMWEKQAPWKMETIASDPDNWMGHMYPNLAL